MTGSIPPRQSVHDELQTVYLHHYAERACDSGKYDIQIVRLRVFVYKLEEIQIVFDYIHICDMAFVKAPLPSRKRSSKPRPAIFADKPAAVNIRLTYPGLDIYTK